jgi:hypothetical protein
MVRAAISCSFGFGSSNTLSLSGEEAGSQSRISVTSEGLRLSRSNPEGLRRVWHPGRSGCGSRDAGGTVELRPHRVLAHLLQVAGPSPAPRRAGDHLAEPGHVDGHVPDAFQMQVDVEDGGEQARVGGDWRVRPTRSTTCRSMSRYRRSISSSPATTAPHRAVLPVTTRGWPGPGRPGPGLPGAWTSTSSRSRSSWKRSWNSPVTGSAWAWHRGPPRRTGAWRGCGRPSPFWHEACLVRRCRSVMAVAVTGSKKASSGARNRMDRHRAPPQTSSEPGSHPAHLPTVAALGPTFERPIGPSPGCRLARLAAPGPWPSTLNCAGSSPAVVRVENRPACEPSVRSARAGGSAPGTPTRPRA